MRIALIGTRGVPARYGGFETAVEEVGARLAAKGHDVVVYCRGGDSAQREYKGMRLVHLPAPRLRAAETLTHTALSVLNQLIRPSDAGVVFNVANAPLLPVLRVRHIPAAVHVDGLEWQRAKWGRLGKRYYRAAEGFGARHADALIADARAIQDYYRTVHGTASWFIPYGAPDKSCVGFARLDELRLKRHSYHLVVTRFEPENNLEIIIQGYQQSAARLPLLVVGGAVYATDYVDQIRELAERDGRVRLVGPIWDQELLDQLYANALLYLHGHSVGGTNPSLLRAVGAGAPVVAFDVCFNREVLGANNTLFSTPDGVASAVEAAEQDINGTLGRGVHTRRDVLQRYDWDKVTVDYERLCKALAAGTARQPPPDLDHDQSRSASTVS
jgi:glycosyltransferase involved in cell wall biosynthesis